MKNQVGLILGNLLGGVNLKSHRKEKAKRNNGRLWVSLIRIISIISVRKVINTSVSHTYY